MGIKPTILGLKSGSITGADGVSLSSELLISFLVSEDAERPLPDALLLAGGAACGHQLLADPRVHQLVQKMGQKARLVGFLRPVSFPLIELLSQQGRNQPFLFQERQKTAEFMHHFLQQLLQVRGMAG